MSPDRSEQVSEAASRLQGAAWKRPPLTTGRSCTVTHATRGPRWALRLELGDYKARTSSRLFYCTFLNALLCMHVIFHDKIIYKNKSPWMSIDAQG